MTKNWSCIHGHFYQPPRENPWLGVIEEQPSAAPFHDWNARITAECYAANARARVLDAEGRIARLTNNFSFLSFNIGPTLFDWLAKNAPATARRIIAADRDSAQRSDGHGNAIAQVYNHMIMPLANARDQYTQIAWGLADFQHRFHRVPEGLWLSECAVNMPTIRACIAHGVRFLILSPAQMSRVRRLDQTAWASASEKRLPTDRAYRVYDVDAAGNKLYHRYLDVFFYDGDVSFQIAFGHLLKNSEKLRTFFRDQCKAGADRIVSAATDGESYGHHERFGEMCLAAFFQNSRDTDSFELGNYAAFLAKHPPQWEAEISLGHRGEGSSWSCCHGVERWYRDCGCGNTGVPDEHQRWREPLRRAIDALRQKLDAVFEREGSALFLDPWDARNAYVHIMLNPDDANRQAFLARHAPTAVGDPQKTVTVWTLLEMQRNAMCMYTSCGWFFHELSGLEPVQNMRYAIRAARYGMRFSSDDLERTFLEALALAPSNNPVLGDGATICKRFVLSDAYAPETIAAAYVFSRMFSVDAPPYRYQTSFFDERSRTVGQVQTLMCGLNLVEGWTQRSHRFAALAARISDREVACVLVPCTDDDAVRACCAGWMGLSESALVARVQDEGISLRQVPPEFRRILLEKVLSARFAFMDDRIMEAYDTMRPLLAVLAENDVPPSPVLRDSAEFVLSHGFTECCERMLDAGRWLGDEAVRARSVLEEAERYHVPIDRTRALWVMERLANMYLKRLSQKLARPELEETTALVRFVRECKLEPNACERLEYLYWDLLHSPALVAEQKGADGVVWQADLLEVFQKELAELGDALDFSSAHLVDFRRRISGSDPDEAL